MSKSRTVKKQRVKTKAITGRISAEAHAMFRRAQRGLSIPTGKLLEFLILDAEEMGVWVELEDSVEKWRNQRDEKRRSRDAERKRLKRQNGGKGVSTC